MTARQQLLSNVMSSNFGADGSDKRNRNPNWTDGEIIRFLELLQEETTLKDLLAQRNKQVFCFVASKLNAEGSEKTWDQCRVKLKNLKSQYRYIKERVPTLDNLDLEDDQVMQMLFSECYAKGISQSNLKHIKYLKRFMLTMDQVRTKFSFGTAASTDSAKTSSTSRRSTNDDDSDRESPSSAPNPPKNLRIPGASSNSEAEPDGNQSLEPSAKKRRVLEPSYEGRGLSTATTLDEGLELIEQFNHDMMGQFLSHQQKVQASFQKWESERQRQHELAMAKWREEARSHEKEMFGMFVKVMGECNNALKNMLHAKLSSASKANVGANVRSENGEENGEAHIKEELLGDAVDDDYEGMIEKIE